MPTRTTRAADGGPPDPAGPGPVGAPSSARAVDLVAALRARTDAELGSLLRARPDLGTPPPSSVTALAARAGSRPSVERALSLLNAEELAVAEAAVALAPLHRPTPGALTAAVGLDAGPAAARLGELALVVGDYPVPALAQALGPHPAGLGPTLAELAEAAAAGGGQAGAAGSPPSPGAVALAAVLDQAPPAAVAVVEALTWGPPVGTYRDALPPGAAWLLDRGVLVRLSATQVVLPREVALAARAGRTHRAPPAPPVVTGLRTSPASVVAAEGVHAAEEADRLLGVLLRTWHHEPASVLRGGGVGVRELRRAATALDAGEGITALLAEVAGMAGLLTQDGEEQLTWRPAGAAAAWAAEPLPVRWAHLAIAWATSIRTPWLVGSRAEQGNLRAALEPGLERSWAASLRRRVLVALAGLPEGAAPSPGQVHALLAWDRPRATPPAATVAAVLAEAAALGLTGGGALTAAGRVLADALDAGTRPRAAEGDGPEAAGIDEGATQTRLAAELERALPEPLTDLLVQGDLTAVVPGRPAPDLADLLALMAEVESRGSALTVRFTPASIRKALDAGLGATELLQRVTGYSRGPLPQALEYLVRDTARTHGQVRVGAAGAYLRTEDPATQATVAGHPALGALALRPIAPTVLVSAAPPAEVLAALRAAGLAPVLEGAGGVVVLDTSGRSLAGELLRSPGGRGRRPRGAPTYPGGTVSTRTRPRADLEAVVGRMRAGEAALRRDAARAGDPPATDPVHALSLLRAAAAAGSPVAVVLVGATGQRERRRVQPVSVEGGRVRMTDLDRQADITVAVHRIVAVGD